MELIHYGELNGGKLLQPQVLTTNPFNLKPDGPNILWTSPARSECSWQMYLEERGIETSFLQSWSIKLSPKANVLRVDSLEDFELVRLCYPPTTLDEKVDWKKIAQEYDAFWLTEEGLCETNSIACGMNSWDCETVVIFNTTVVDSVIPQPRRLARAEFDLQVASMGLVYP